SGWRAWQPVQIVEVVVRIETRLSSFAEYVSVILIGAALGHELDLHCTFAAALCAGSGSRHSNLSYRIAARANVCEESVAGSDQVVLNVQPVNRDIERTLRQPVY